MPEPTNAPAPSAPALCAVGLLLTVVEVSGFGFDFASDTVGFVLVAVGAFRMRTGPARRWSVLAMCSAAAGAVVSLFVYGGPGSDLVPPTYAWWDTLFQLDTATTAGVVCGLLLLLRSRMQAAGPTSPVASTALGLVLAYAFCAAVAMLLFAVHAAYAGPLGYLRQAVQVALDLVAVLTVVVAFLAARVGAEAPRP